MGEYFNRSNRPHRFDVFFGDYIVHDFATSTDEDGREIVVTTGSKNQDEIVQCGKEQCLIENIIGRYLKGDTSVLEKAPSFYADLTTLPADMISAHNHIENINRQFESLPADIKSKFDNSVNVFLKQVSEMDVDTYLDCFGIKQVPIENESEVDNSNEQK